MEISNYEMLMIKRRNKRKKTVRICVVCSVVFLLVLTAVFVGKSFGIFNFKKELNAKTLECPKFVEKQIIHRGLARTGVKLVEINNIVIHYTGNPNSTAQNNRDYFDKLDTEVCSHFVIGLDGEIIQCVPIDEKSAASNNRNLDTISIEVCHPDESGKFNQATYNSLIKLTAWLCDNSGIKAEDVIRHYDITGKECPKYFVDNTSEWNDFLNDVKTELENY